MSVTSKQALIAWEHRVAEWVCLCGARNRLRDTACRNCGEHKPTMED